MKNKAAQELGKLGGLNTAKNMTPKQKRERAKKAAQKRWEKHEAKDKK